MHEFQQVDEITTTIQEPVCQGLENKFLCRPTSMEGIGGQRQRKSQKIFVTSPAVVFHISLDPRYFCVLRFAFFLFFFSFLHAFQTFRGQANSRVLFGPVFFYFSVNQWVRALFMNPQISFFINFFIKNGSHSTIHTFKNYFATVF